MLAKFVKMPKLYVELQTKYIHKLSKIPQKTILRYLKFWTCLILVSLTCYSHVGLFSFLTRIHYVFLQSMSSPFFTLFFTNFCRIFCSFLSVAVQECATFDYFSYPRTVLRVSNSISTSCIPFCTCYQVCAIFHLFLLPTVGLVSVKFNINFL